MSKIIMAKEINFGKIEARVPRKFMEMANHIIVQRGFDFKVVKNISNMCFEGLVVSKEFAFVDYKFVERYNPNKATYNEHVMALKEMEYNSSKNFVIQYDDFVF